MFKLVFCIFPMQRIATVLFLLPLISPVAPLSAKTAVSVAKLRDATARQQERFRTAFQVMEKAVATRAFPGAVLAVGCRSELVALKAFGKFDYSRESTAVATDTIYDLASVSKVVGTTSAAALLYQQGKLRLEAPLVRYLPEFGGVAGHDRITVRQLLTHTSGLPAYERLFGMPVTSKPY